MKIKTFLFFIRRPLAICVKALTYPYADRSLRLLEWVEASVALGADVFLYPYRENNANITKLLRCRKHKRFTGFLSVRNGYSAQTPPFAVCLGNLYVNNN